MTATAQTAVPLDLTHHWIGYTALAAFAIAYVLAMLEEVTMLRKSKPMVFAASLIWILIAWAYVSNGMSEESGQAFRTTVESYAELFLFILVSMTYLNAMEQRGVFDRLRIWLLSKGFGYRKLFWITGLQSFLLSSVCNNLTTALLMGAVVVAMAKNNRRFISIACANIVIATNAGILQPVRRYHDPPGLAEGCGAVHRFFPPAAALAGEFRDSRRHHAFLGSEGIPESAGKPRPLPHGAKGIIVLFVLTIATAVCFENILKLPPAAGMLTGLTYLSFYFFYLYKVRVEWPRGRRLAKARAAAAADGKLEMPYDLAETKQHFDVFHNIARLEWDTLLYFYGVMVGVGGLSFLGYLTLASNFLYTDIEPTIANILVGIVSAFVDNGTIMYAILSMAPALSEGQWLLVTLTAGVGGSLLAIGSAAGVGLMGQTKGAYSFGSHLKWTPVIALGYAGSILVHFLINRPLF